ncbi:putative Hpr(Ser) kinase/phosphatase [Magnetofaba australis IT-1]|uniref:Putative Hpr(Ser) kinase/phosphatase n=1 Tax=Magnetofaba australis IT-1 TaxID=1434232 RepID=A0A1Y2K8C1_9PROT|nr:putative Hpr(Ser) kinase/phosphatase [Magnetofaba australis IT-1]
MGPFALHLRSDAPGLADAVRLLYAHHPAEIAPPWATVADVHAAVLRAGGLRRWWRPQVRFHLEGPSPFQPFPADHAMPLLEWGMNFGVSSRANRYLMLHAAAVAAPDDSALILPGRPGSGKSTLATALAFRGWRLLSDEFGLVRPESGMMHPFPRPTALKNEAIDALAACIPEAQMGPRYLKTRKGTVCHVQPPAASVAAMARPAWPRWLLAPQYEAGAPVQWQELDPMEAFLRLGGGAFNYELLGRTGFDAVARISDDLLGCWSLTYGDLNAAIAAINERFGVR